MRLTKNNIAFVNEMIRTNHKTVYAVVMKDKTVTNTRIYEAETKLDLPKTVYEFILSAKCECIEHNEKFGLTRYQYK